MEGFKGQFWSTITHLGILTLSWDTIFDPYLSLQWRGPGRDTSDVLRRRNRHGNFQRRHQRRQTDGIRKQQNQVPFTQGFFIENLIPNSGPVRGLTRRNLWPNSKFFLANSAATCS